WHARVAHGRRSDPTRTSHLEHHRTAHLEVEPWAEMRENAGRVGGTAGAVAAALLPIVGASAALPVAVGLLAGDVCATLAHTRMHERAPESAWEEWMWRFHFHHHYGNAKANFGLTSPLFDFVFGTAEIPSEVAIPEASLPAWFRDGHRGFRVRSASRSRA